MAAGLVVNLQGSNVCASDRTVIVMPTTVGTRATSPELCLNLGGQNSLSFSALILRHVYIIHSAGMHSYFKLTRYHITAHEGKGESFYAILINPPFRGKAGAVENATIFFWVMHDCFR